MSLHEPHMALLLPSTLSLNDLPVYCPRLDLYRTMSLPSVKKRLQVFRRGTSKRRKTTPDRDTTLEIGISLPTASTPGNDEKTQAAVASVQRTPSPTRKRDLVQHWLSQRSKRIGQVSHRCDSVVPTTEEIQEIAKLTSEDAGHAIAGPDGESMPAYVIDDFFKLYSAGGSDWKESWRWQIHLDRWEDHKTRCSKGICDYCRKMRREGKELPPPYLSPSLPVLPASPVSPQNSLPETGEPENGRSTVPTWRYKSHRRRGKGKELALDQDCYSSPDGSLLSSQTHALVLPPVRSRALRAPENGIVIREAVERQKNKPIRCSFSVAKLDPRQIPVPAVPDLYPEDSSALDLSDISHVTGRPYGASPLEGDRLPFPLSNNLLPPPTPDLKPDQHLTSIPEPLRLEEPSEASPNGAPFRKSPLARFNPKATRVQRGGFSEPVTLVKASETTAQSAVSILLNQLHNGPPSASLKKRGRLHRSPGPSLPPLPTLLNPRNSNTDNRAPNSEASGPDPTFTARGKLPARSRRIPPGPADRDPRVCTLSDTTGSPLPDCPVYVNARQARDRKNEEMARRHWPGMCIWRYHCDDDSDGED